jgi:NAD(P)-dependent dehydrogenase (short-subunit alcohol dehydrogenase family)
MRIVVTGGNSGVGKATAAALAAAGHSVVIACRTLPKAERAAAEMAGDVEVRHLDLADLGSVRTFAEAMETVDVLVNNAGILGMPLTRTADGFEAHIGTNHLGHFALTCLLGDKITDRVISVGSASYVFGRIHLEDLNWHTRRYSKWAAYAQSKLANMLFIHELARRGVRAYISDPGGADTDITRDSTGLLHWLGEHKDLPLHIPTQSPPDAARASIEAVTTDLPTGSYLAPRFSLWGKPKPTKIRKKACDPEMARRLWELSADLTGCDWSGWRSRIVQTKIETDCASCNLRLPCPTPFASRRWRSPGKSALRGGTRPSWPNVPKSSATT